MNNWQGRIKVFTILLVTVLSVVMCRATVFASLDRTGSGADELARLRQFSSDIRTVASDFTQEKYLAIFKHSLTSKGKFYYRYPESLRWEILDPVVTGFVLNGERGWRWHEQTGRTERFSTMRDPVMKIVAEQLLAWAKTDLDWLEERYDIEVEDGDRLALKLTPNGSVTAMQEFVDHIRIVFAEGDSPYVQKVEIHEMGGDFTRIRFDNTVVNSRLPVTLFDQR